MPSSHASQRGPTPASTPRSSPGRVSPRGPVHRATHPFLLVALAMATGLLAPGVARAQFASGLTPPPERASAREVAAAESVVVAKRDSVAREQRLDMRAWVDSAASSLERGGTPVAPVPERPGTVPKDSTAPVPPLPTPPLSRPAPPPPAARRTPGAPSPGFRPGMPAPDTATPLPALALTGLLMLGSGVALVRRRR